MGSCCSKCSVSVASAAGGAPAGGTPAAHGSQPASNAGSTNSHPRPATPHPARNGTTLGRSPSPTTGVTGLGIRMAPEQNGQVPSPPSAPTVSHVPAAVHLSSPGPSTADPSPDEEMPPLRLHSNSVTTPRSSLSSSQRRFGMVYYQDPDRNSDAHADSSPHLAILCNNNHRGQLRAEGRQASGGNRTSVDSSRFSSARSHPGSN
jgi:hypothetical protein